ncbi:MAG: methyltransferase domain-containing protein [Synechococcales cyanobacterium T60_A2020_003]|nr:methyltransferase domain-containing protein [Synechococcales cyanobacterium T60_A2020_003]
MADTLTKVAYQTFQQGKGAFGLAHKTLSSRFLNLLAPIAEHRKTEPLPPEVLSQFQQRANELMETDWHDAEAGVYPTSLLFDNPWQDFFQFYPMLWFDMPKSWFRANQKQYQAFSPEIRTEGYPDYYVQNFHQQTDGYLSDESANLYDLQVEILFNGTADPMRRRVLAPLKQGLQVFSGVPSHQIRILDVACGTGRTLRMLRGMLPDASLFGTDLSPAYLRKANQILSEIPGELPQLLQANAESLPYVDNYFHGLTCVFLFHELPASVRQTVIHECFRVLQPGGTLVICDSIQEKDSPEFAVSMRNFPVMFHEPYYRHYIVDDIDGKLQKAGFEMLETQIHLMSKYWIVRKPGE